MSDPILAAPVRFQRRGSLRNPARSRAGVPAHPGALRRLAQPDIGPTHDPYGPLFGLRYRPKPDHSAPLNSGIGPFDGTGASIKQALERAVSTPLPARSPHNPSERETPGKPSASPLACAGREGDRALGPPYFRSALQRPCPNRFRLAPSPFRAAPRESEACAPTVPGVVPTAAPACAGSADRTQTPREVLRLPLQVPSQAGRLR